MCVTCNYTCATCDVAFTTDCNTCNTLGTEMRTPNPIVGIKVTCDCHIEYMEDSPNEACIPIPCNYSCK